VNSKHAPVALFAWQRPEHTRMVLKALLRNPEAGSTDLYAFVDGPRNERESAISREVIEVINNSTGFRSTQLIVSPVNRGLANSITQGVSTVVDERDRVIVIEDDIVVTPNFLGYMNTALDMYADDESVASIHGYCYPVTQPLPTTFFIRGADCWGWATWSRAWRHFNPDGAALLQAIAESGSADQFDFDGTAGYLDMLDKQVQGKVDSWAVRWYAATFLDGMYTLYPGASLVENIGMDGTGRHSGLSDHFEVTVDSSPRTLTRIPIQDSAQGRQAFTEFFLAMNDDRNLPFARRWLRRSARMLGRVLPEQSRSALIKAMPARVKRLLK